MLIERSIFTRVKKSVFGERKVNIIYGPRQSGKTTLLNRLVEEIKDKQELIFFNGEDIRVQDLLSQNNLAVLAKTVGKRQYLFIDEAQKIPNIGTSLKLLYDSLPVVIVASGSSSFDLANKINEPLTGRTQTFYLYPLSYQEVPVILPDINKESKIEDFLRFGMYPKVITLASEAEREGYLAELINNYLYRDILAFENVRKPRKIIDLLTLLALQIGSEVSIAELGANLSLAKIVVEKYLDILEKMFIIRNIRGFARNLRKEIYKMSKYYFYDLGFRNALIQNFNHMKLRNDTGSLFENFCIMERIKALQNSGYFANHYFWRTYDQKEIDLIEERKGKISGFEFKWGEERLSKAVSQEFKNTYPGSSIKLVTPSDLEKYLG